ncbi:MAG: hypothetical protein ABIE92_02950, partial [bacterium]
RIETTEELMYYGYTEAKLEFYFHSDPIPVGSDVYLGIARIFPDGFAERVDSLYTTDNTSRTVTLDLTRLCDQETLFKLELSAIYSEFGATIDAVISLICVYAK